MTEMFGKNVSFFEIHDTIGNMIYVHSYDQL